MKVKIRLTEDMLGTVPKNREIFSRFVVKKSVDLGLAQEEAETVEDLQEKGYTGFHSDSNGIFIYSYMVKGFLKHAGTVLKDSLKVKNLKSKIDDYVFVYPRKIYFNKQVPDGTMERSLTVMTMKGPRVCLAKSDIVNAGTELEFVIELIPHKEITEDTISTLLAYGRHMGLGQFRNGGYGSFIVL